MVGIDNPRQLWILCKLFSWAKSGSADSGEILNAGSWICGGAVRESAYSYSYAVAASLPAFVLPWICAQKYVCVCWQQTSQQTWAEPMYRKRPAKLIWDHALVRLFIPVRVFACRRCSQRFVKFVSHAWGSLHVEVLTLNLNALSSQPSSSLLLSSWLS